MENDLEHTISGLKKISLMLTETINDKRTAKAAYQRYIAREKQLLKDKSAYCERLHVEFGLSVSAVADILGEPLGNVYGYFERQAWFTPKRDLTKTKEEK